jgi:hypothetical protein
MKCEIRHILAPHSVYPTALKINVMEYNQAQKRRHETRDTTRGKERKDKERRAAVVRNEDMKMAVFRDVAPSP